MVFAAARPRLGWLWDHRRRHHHHHHHSDHGHCLANNADDRVPCMCQPASRQSVNKSNIASHCFCSFLLIVRPKKRKHAIGSKTRQDRDPEELLPGGRLLRRLGSGADEGTIHRRLIFPHYIYECSVAYDLHSDSASRTLPYTEFTLGLWLVGGNETMSMMWHSVFIRKN